MLNSQCANPGATWQVTRGLIDLAQARVMGIVNLTPDSFSDAGRLPTPAAALAHCERLIAQGADLLDIGGESTRPGASAPGAQEELARVLPVLRVAVTLGVPVSVDTSEPAVMQQALDLGVDIVNDVRSLQRPGAVQVLLVHGRAGVCLMHMRGEPATMATLAHYHDVVTEVLEALKTRCQQMQSAGICASRLVLDPGIGFAKSASHNLELLARQNELRALGRPLLVGWSRKGTLGQITERPVAERGPASVAAALIAVQRGAAVVRVHDVAATVDALKVWRAVKAVSGSTIEVDLMKGPVP